MKAGGLLIVKLSTAKINLGKLISTLEVLCAPKENMGHIFVFAEIFLFAVYDFAFLSYYFFLGEV